jgi:hypothetical protein
MFITLNSQGIRTITTLGGSVRSIASTFIIAGWKIHYPARYYARDVNVIVFLSYDSAIGLLFLTNELWLPEFCTKPRLVLLSQHFSFVDSYLVTMARQVSAVTNRWGRHPRRTLRTIEM